MTGEAKLRLQIRVCVARNRSLLMTLKRLKQKKNSFAYFETKMSIVEDFMRNGVPRLAVDTWFLMHDI